MPFSLVINLLLNTQVRLFLFPAHHRAPPLSCLGHEDPYRYTTTLQASGPQLCPPGPPSSVSGLSVHHVYEYRVLMLHIYGDQQENL